MNGSTRLLGGMVLAVAAVAVPGTAAHAAPPVEHEHYEWSETATFEECGLTLESSASGSGHFMVTEVAGSDGQAYLAHDNYTFRDVLTNTENGEWFVIRGRGLFKEMTGVHVKDDIWEFTAQDVGQPFVIEDSDGKVVLRDRGRLTYRQLFDTLGDGQPGGLILEDELTGVSGPHPSFTADFCEVILDLLG
jgi:hypothetical protein